MRVWNSLFNNKILEYRKIKDINSLKGTNDFENLFFSMNFDHKRIAQKRITRELNFQAVVS